MGAQYCRAPSRNGNPDRSGFPDRVRSHLLAEALIGDLGLLGCFKYYGFFVGNIATLSAHFGLPAPLPLLQVALPVLDILPRGRSHYRA